MPTNMECLQAMGTGSMFCNGSTDADCFQFNGTDPFNTQLAQYSEFKNSDVNSPWVEGQSRTGILYLPTARMSNGALYPVKCIERTLGSFPSVQARAHYDMRDWYRAAYPQYFGPDSDLSGYAWNAAGRLYPVSVLNKDIGGHQHRFPGIHVNVSQANGPVVAVGADERSLHPIEFMLIKYAKLRGCTAASARFPLNDFFVWYLSEFRRVTNLSH